MGGIHCTVTHAHDPPTPRLPLPLLLPLQGVQDGEPLQDVPAHLQHQPMMNKSTAKEVVAAALPVPEAVLQAHQNVVATLTARMRQRKVAERAQVRWHGPRDSCARGRPAPAALAAQASTLPAWRSGSQEVGLDRLFCLKAPYAPPNRIHFCSAQNCTASPTALGHRHLESFAGPCADSGRH